MIYAVLVIVVFFVIGMLLRQYLKSLCAICFAVSATWIIGLVFSLIPGASGLVEPLALGILMGGSVVGGLYYLGPRIRKELHIFKLPYVVTTFLMAYSVIEQSVDIESVIGVVVIWLIFFALYLLRNKSARDWFTKIVACCRDW